MALPLTTEQKTRIVEWFLQTNSIVTVQRRFKNQYKCKAAPARNMVKTLVEQFRATGNMAGKKRGGSKPRVRTPDTVGTIRASVASSPARKSVRQLAAENKVLPSTAWRILRTNLRMHPYKIHVFQSLTTVCREKADKVCGRIRWSLAAEPSHSGTHLVLNPCDYFLWGYLKDKVFSSAPRTLPELKERIKECCAQVIRGMLTRVVQNFVLRLQAVREFQGAHIEHVIHNATHIWNSNPCLLLWHCFHINKFAIANALLSWKWQ